MKTRNLLRPVGGACAIHALGLPCGTPDGATVLSSRQVAPRSGTSAEPESERCGRDQVPATKNRPSFAGGSRAAKVSGYEHEYAATDLVQPGARASAHAKDAAAKIRNIPSIDIHMAQSAGIALVAPVQRL